MNCLEVVSDRRSFKWIWVQMSYPSMSSPLNLARQRRIVLFLHIVVSGAVFLGTSLVDHLWWCLVEPEDQVKNEEVVHRQEPFLTASSLILRGMCVARPNLRNGFLISCLIIFLFSTPLFLCVCISRAKINKKRTGTMLNLTPDQGDPRS